MSFMFLMCFDVLLRLVEMLRGVPMRKQHGGDMTRGYVRGYDLGIPPVGMKYDPSASRFDLF